MGVAVKILLEFEQNVIELAEIFTDGVTIGLTFITITLLVTPVGETHVSLLVIKQETWSPFTSWFDE